MIDFFRNIRTILSGRDEVPVGHRGIVDIYGREIENGLEFFYPKQIVGIPVFSPESIYNHYRERIESIRLESGIGEHRLHDGKTQLDLLFTDVVLRYIEYIHMLPASENHHHCTPGGLIVHSLEASFHTQKYAKEHKPESTGLSDIDRASLPKYRYAAWLASLLHDAGKVLRDIIVHAVEVEYKGKNTKVTNDNPVPIWRPQKETLVAWAKSHHVATYSITYLKDRIHNQHNVDSIQVLQPVLGQGFALDYLLDSPSDVHGQLVRILAGHMNGKDYLSTSVRRGDTLSTSQNMAQSSENNFMTSQSLSTSAKIFKALKIAQRNWTYNEANSEAFVIGGEVYLRYTKAFHSIVKTALANDLSIPNKIETVTMVMEDAGIIESFDENHRSVKFCAGEFTDKQLSGIQTGKQVVTWSTLIKVKWKGLIFGEEATPDSLSGVFYASESDKLIEVNTYGECKLFESAQSATSNNLSTSPTEQDTPISTQVTPTSDTPKSHPSQTPSDSPSATPKSKLAKTKRPAIVFKNAPTSPPEQDVDSRSDNISSNPELSTIETATDKSLQHKSVAPSESQSDTEQQNHKPTESLSQPEPQNSESTTDTQQHLPLDENAISSAPDSNSVSLPFVYTSIPSQQGHYSILDDVMSYYEETSKPAAIKRLITDGHAFLVNDKPVIVLHKISKKKEQMIRVNLQSPEFSFEHNNQSPPSPSHSDVPDQTEDTLGLHIVLKNAQPGTLAAILSQMLADDEDRFFGHVLFHDDQGLSINISDLVDFINDKTPGAHYQLRHLTKSCRALDIEYKKRQINKSNYIVLAATSLNKISIEV